VTPKNAERKVFIQRKNEKENDQRLRKGKDLQRGEDRKDIENRIEISPPLEQMMTIKSPASVQGEQGK